MLRILKVAVAGLVLLGVWRMGSAAYEYYRFEDAVEEATKSSSSQDELQQKILDIASSFNLPLSAADVHIVRQGDHTLVDASYIKPIEVVPTYRYPYEFKIHVERWAVAPAKLSFPRG
jgi:hypothetical protein